MTRRRALRWRRLVLVLALAAAAAWLMPGAARWWHRRQVEQRVTRFDAMITTHAQRTGLPADLIRAIVRAESGGDPAARSAKNAHGLMQVTAHAETDALRSLERERGDLYDPEYNLLIGTTYLKQLYDRFEGDLHLTVAAYHMGPTRVSRLRRKRPDVDSATLVQEEAGPATRAYVQQVLSEP